MRQKLILTIGILVFLASLCFASWDNTKPADNQLWNTAASSMRDNWDALEVEMGVDLALNHPYFQAAEPTFKPDGTTALDSTDLGRLWVDSDDNKMYAFTAVTPTWTPFPAAGSTNTWADTQTFSVAAVWTLGVVPNNTFITATDQAGTGTVDLIKANASDAAVIPDGSQLATSGAPSADADIANKKYVDDQLVAADPAYTGGESHTFGGGLIIKMGILTNTGGAENTVTFNVAFPNAAISATANHKDLSQATDAIVIKTLNTAVLTVLHSTNVNDDIYWIAIGH